MTSINIPKLRFPEFSGEWEKKRLGEVTTWKSGGTPPKENNEYWGGNVPWISGSSMKGNEYFDSEVKLTELGVKNGSKIAAKGSLLLLVRGSMLFNKIPVGIAMRDLAFNQDVKSISPLNTLESKYVLYWFISKENVLMDLVSGTGIGAGKLDISDLQGQEFVYPSLPEQQKISSFLTAVNDKLQGLKKKKSLLEQYKKGVMQKIFSQELRFKADDGSDFPEWEVKKLGEIAKITTGSSNRQDSNLDGEFTFFDRSLDIRTSDRYLFDKEAIIVPGEGQEFIPKYFKGKFDLHQRTYAIMDFDEIDGKFLFYSISFNSNHLNSHAVGSTVKSLRLPMFETMPIMLPSLSEQTKISKILSAIDEKIQMMHSQIEKMEMWKKGLLQKMFV